MWEHVIAILSDPSVSVDLILDGEQVNPAAVKMALECKDSDKVCLIRDANVTAGMPEGRYKSYEYDVTVENEGALARCAEDAPNPGTLSGSSLTMDMAGMKRTLHCLMWAAEKTLLKQQ